MRHLTWLVLLTSSVATAGPLVEPYLGYAVGTARPTGGQRATQAGASYGARVGYQRLGAMAGVDYSTGSWRDTAHPSNALTPSQLGIFVGYNLLFLLRGYVEFIPIARLTAEHSNFERTFDGGDAVKYGVGFTGLPFVSVNLEYVNAHYRGLDTEMYSINVSLPVLF